MAFSLTAMGMPQNQAYENRILCRDKDKERRILATGGSSRFDSVYGRTS